MALQYTMKSTCYLRAGHTKSSSLGLKPATKTSYKILRLTPPPQISHIIVIDLLLLSLAPPTYRTGPSTWNLSITFRRNSLLLYFNQVLQPNNDAWPWYCSPGRSRPRVRPPCNAGLTRIANLLDRPSKYYYKPIMEFKSKFKTIRNRF